MRYFLEFSYRGTAYHGWQRQPNAFSVQEELERCMSLILGYSVEVVAAGRTDAGVHASKMFGHFDVPEPLSADFLIRINAFLPRDIAVYRIRTVNPEAHARFDALSRTYKYHVVQRKDPFRIDSAYWVQSTLDFEAMNLAASYLLGLQDFKCFSRSNTDVKTFNCHVFEAYWTQESDLWVFTISADRFLRNMVRAVVGTLILVGKHKIAPEAVKDIIKSKSRSQAGASVPAKGLYLNEIIYPQSVFIDG